MHRCAHRFAPATIAALATMALATPIGAQTVRISPIGDSITESFVGMPSYRFYLDRLLTDAGYDFDFVGTQHGVAFGPARHQGFDQDHEGHGGWIVDWVLRDLDSWLPVSRPDIVIMHIGTNDVGRRSTAGCIAGLGLCIDEIRAHRPFATIVLAKLIPIRHRDVTPFNDALPALVATKDSATSRVVLADLNTGFEPRFWLPDGVHPSDDGEAWMAARLFAALRPFLTKRGEPYASYGPGCSAVTGDGSAPRLDRIRGQAPCVGEWFTVRVDSVSPSVTHAFAMLGFGAVAPIDLRGIGMPGCALHVAPVLVAGMHGTTSYTWSLELPDTMSLVGVAFYQQALVVDPAANALGLLMSNATVGRLFR